MTHRFLGAGAALLLFAVACSSSSPAPPATYQLGFASTAIAVATDTVEVQVYDAKGREATFCNEALVKKRNNQDVGTVIAQSAPRSPCDVLAGKADALDVGFGIRGFVGIAKRGGQDFLLGCLVTNVGPGTPAPLLLLNYATQSVQPAPATTCQDLSQRCSGGC